MAQRIPLDRLAERRHLSLGELAQAAGVAETDVAAVVGGAPARPAVLRRLAPALRLHTADLFVIAGVPVPDDLAPQHRNGSHHLVWAASFLPGAVDALLEFVRSLPRQPITHPVPSPPPYQQYPLGGGALMLRLCRNRNLEWTDTAKALMGMAGIGPMSASTVGMVGHGQRELTPELLAGFATVLGIAAGDLAVLTGVEAPPSAPPPRAGAAELIWASRRLSADQMRQVDDLEHTLRHRMRAQLRRTQRCNCQRHADVTR